ncbi:MAG: thioredoxin family protein [Robiginitalea sp.]|nr:thioredoxin family protein [Robiginitalea sp.]
MARTPSTMLPLGTKAPWFELPDTVSGEERSLGALKGEKGTLIMFICNHCPFVKHVNPELVRLAGDYQDRGIGFIAISSNDVENYPEDHPDKMKETAAREGYPFPYLYDASQEVAREYQAACTPDFYLFDSGLELVYRGQLDSSRPGNEVPVTGEDLRHALDSLLEGRPVPSEQKPSLGCNIKWKETT